MKNSNYEIMVVQTGTERYKQQISKRDCDMMAYLQTHFDEDILTKLSRQWEKI